MRWAAVALGLALAPTSHAIDVDVGPGIQGGSARMVGMGGAYRAIAEGPPAHRVNPAAIAVAPTYTDPTTWRWNGLFVVRKLIPTAETIDLNPVAEAPLPTADISLGLLARRGQHAAAIRLDWRSQTDEPSGQSVLLADVSAGYGLALADERLHLGIAPGLLIVRANPDARRSVTVLPTLALGARVDVPKSPLRLGASLYTPSGASVADATVDRLRLPWEGGLGLAYRRGLMARGPRLRGEDAIPRTEPWFVQVAVDGTLFGRMRDVTSIEAWTRGEPSGEDIPVQASLAVGVETAPLPYHLRLRMGVSTEPARANPERGLLVHGALGADIALFEWPKERWRWRLSPALDVSAVGVSPALGLGLW